MRIELSYQLVPVGDVTIGPRHAFGSRTYWIQCIWSLLGRDRYFLPSSLSLCSCIAFFFAGYSTTTSSFLSES